MKAKAQRKPPAWVAWSLVNSPAGKLLIGVTEKGLLCRASFVRERDVVELVGKWEREWPATHFEPGKAPKDFMGLPLLMVGTPFQVKAWQAVRKIGKGSVMSYGEVAARIGVPRAPRAVGTACGGNVLAYVVPCHRVVSSSGIGGYGPAGLDFKRKLLKKEGVVVA